MRNIVRQHVGSAVIPLTHLLTYLLNTQLVLMSSTLLRPLRWLFNKLLSKSAKLTRPQFSTSTSIRFIPGFAQSMITWSCIVQSTVSTSSPFNNTCQVLSHTPVSNGNKYLSVSAVITNTNTQTYTPVSSCHNAMLNFVYVS